VAATPNSPGSPENDRAGCPAKAGVDLNFNLGLKLRVDSDHARGQRGSIPGRLNARIEKGTGDGQDSGLLLALGRALEGSAEAARPEGAGCRPGEHGGSPSGEKRPTVS